MMWLASLLAILSILSLSGNLENIRVLGYLDSDGIVLDGRCTHMMVRQEWRKLSIPHRQQYIQAVKCTQNLRNITSFEGVRSRFDDFQAVHINTADEVHYVGHFLPWHRRFVSIYENTLRNECGYRGAIPYWDWTQDADGGKSLQNSPIFDPITGFGGNGVPGTYSLPKNFPNDSGIFPETFVGCVEDGPFSSFTVHLGPGKMITDHCLVRGIDDALKGFLSSKAVNRALAKPTFEKFRVELEGGENRPSEHGSGHVAVGGDFGNLYSSPADPIFFLHHGNLDRIWWQWQTENLERRLSDISGKAHGGHGGQDNVSIALEYLLDVGPLGKHIPIRDVMDIRETPLCYIYE